MEVEAPRSYVFSADCLANSRSFDYCVGSSSTCILVANQDLEGHEIAKVPRGRARHRETNCTARGGEEREERSG